MISRGQRVSAKKSWFLFLPRTFISARDLGCLWKSHLSCNYLAVTGSRDVGWDQQFLILQPHPLSVCVCVQVCAFVLRLYPSQDRAFHLLQNPENQRCAVIYSITILLEKLNSSSLSCAMLGAYNNTVKNPDPEKNSKADSTDASTALCHSCCYYTDTATFLIQSCTNTCPKYEPDPNHIYQKNRKKKKKTKKSKKSNRLRNEKQQTPKDRNWKISKTMWMCWISVPAQGTRGGVAILAKLTTFVRTETT